MNSDVAAAAARTFAPRPLWFRAVFFAAAVVRRMHAAAAAPAERSALATPGETESSINVSTSTGVSSAPRSPDLNPMSVAMIGTSSALTSISVNAPSTSSFLRRIGMRGPHMARNAKIRRITWRCVGSGMGPCRSEDDMSFTHTPCHHFDRWWKNRHFPVSAPLLSRFGVAPIGLLTMGCLRASTRVNANTRPSRMSSHVFCQNAWELSLPDASGGVSRRRSRGPV